MSRSRRVVLACVGAGALLGASAGSQAFAVPDEVAGATLGATLGVFLAGGTAFALATRRQQQMLAARLTAQLRGAVPEIQSALALDRLAQSKVPLPSLGGWAVPPSLAVALASLLIEERPATVVELGSGASTSVMAEVIRTHGLNARLISLDHDEAWGARTRADLRRRGITTVEVRHAPLAWVDVNGEKYRWYELQALADVAEIDLLLVDGPPSQTGPLARLPAGPVLLPRMRNGGIVVVDDASRRDETEMTRRWMEQFALEPRLETPMSHRFTVYRVTPSGHDA